MRVHILALASRRRRGFQTRRPEVRLLPSVRATDRYVTRNNGQGGGDMPTNINPKLISWATEVDPETIRQAEKTARLPIVAGHVALMPDAHVGLGATVGSVIPTAGAVIPSAVGVDIGCGMVAAELDVTEDQLPDALDPLLVRIESAIPAGVGKGHDRAGAQRGPVARAAPARDRAVGRPGRQGREAVRHARLGEPFLRAVRRRAAPGVGRPALGQPGHRQPARADAHRHGPQAGHGVGAAARGPATSRTSPRARRSSAPTSPTCCGPRTTRVPTVTR